MSKYFIFIIFIFYVFDKTYTRDYGKFKLSVMRMKVCKGPKPTDCCIINAKLTNNTNLDYTIDILKTNTPNRGKIIVTMNNQQLLRFQMKKPCDHLYMKPIFQAILNASQSCEFQKGKHHITLDIEKVTQEYYRGEFLYGNMTFKSVFYNDECNFSCMEFESIFSPL